MSAADDKIPGLRIIDIIESEGSEKAAEEFIRHVRLLECVREVNRAVTRRRLLGDGLPGRRRAAQAKSRPPAERIAAMGDLMPEAGSKP